MYEESRSNVYYILANNNHVRTNEHSVSVANFGRSRCVRAPNTWISPSGSKQWINNTTVECSVIEDAGLLSARLSGTA